MITRKWKFAFVTCAGLVILRNVYNRRKLEKEELNKPKILESWSCPDTCRDECGALSIPPEGGWVSKSPSWSNGDDYRDDIVNEVGWKKDS